MANSLGISQTILNEMVNHCRFQLPFEACGFLIGTTAPSRIVYKSTTAINQATTLNKYIIDPFAYYTLEHSLDNSEVTIIGFYHSHPDGSAKPSRFDIQDAWPDYSYLIIALTGEKVVTIKSWQIDPKTSECKEEPIRVLEN